MALPGNPQLLTDRAGTLTASASRISQAASDLRTLAYQGTAKSLDGIRERSRDVARDLDDAHDRYGGTAQALVEYATVLTDAHRRANAADAAEATANTYGAQADATVAALAQHVRALEAADAPQGTIDTAQQRLDEAQRTARRYDNTVSTAHGDHEAARADMEAAAERAMTLISHAIDATNEGWLDHVGNFFEGIGQWLADLGKWLGDFLQDVWDELQRLVSTVLAVLGAVLILVLVYTLLSMIPVIGPLIAALVVGILAGFLLGSILSDVLKPTPEVGECEPDSDERKVERGEPSDLAHALKDAAYVDQLGHEYVLNPDGSIKRDENGKPVTTAEETVIKVSRVVDADGIVRWRVALPSTQEWLSRFGDHGAVNDLDSNLALMLTPSLHSQYERAVLEAMAQAGVGSDDPVMLVGFSQGGIMAGNLAAYNSDYNWDAVVVAGAPIDSMPIPSSTKVVSVQHDWDPVPRLDTVIAVGTGGYAPENTENRTTIQEASPLASAGVEGIHNAAAYNQTLQASIDQVPASTRDALDDYFIGGDSAYGYQTTYYGWNED